MRFTRAQIVAMQSIAMAHVPEAEFEIVDTNDKGSHALKATEGEFVKLYWVPTAGGYAASERRKEDATAL